MLKRYRIWDVDYQHFIGYPTVLEFATIKEAKIKLQKIVHQMGGANLEVVSLEVVSNDK